ncbi:MAG: T9SS type A sorting domain-containing protein [Bacteroidota bacterium]|nr:T9SS type A sorting domain-containing protein [Bacteroidota bacterium]
MITITMILFLFGGSLAAQNTSIPVDDPDIKSWSTQCTVHRGPTDISNPDSPDADYGTAENATGAADGQLISLGDKGYAILDFTDGISDGTGIDFAIFSNAFYSPANQDSLVFAELAFVEVSSDGENFVRFPAISQIPVNEQIGTYGTLNINHVYNLAGAHPINTGCGFDLSELEDSAALDISNITHVKIVDACGNIDTEYASYDAEGNIINDPWPTEFSSCGFDLDAVAVLNTSTNVTQHQNNALHFYPNPVKNYMHVSDIPDNAKYTIYDASACIVTKSHISNNKINVSNLAPGLYIIQITTREKMLTATFIK